MNDTFATCISILVFLLTGYLVYLLVIWGWLNDGLRVSLLYRTDKPHTKFKAGKKRPIESWCAETGDVVWYPSVAAAKRDGAIEVYKYLNKSKTYQGLIWRDAECSTD